jgi:uncharacterized membrane protein
MSSKSGDVLVVAVFDDAEAAWDTVVQAQVSGASRGAGIEDACVISRDSAGRVHIRESVEPSARAAAGYGGVWGLVIGAFLGFPLAAAGGGAVAGGYALRRRDFGITAAFEQTVAERLRPGTAAAIALVEPSAAPAFERLAVGQGAWATRVQLNELADGE